MSAAYLRQTSEGVVIGVRVQPNAKRSELAGVHGEELKIRVHAPPVEGKANAELIEFLRERLELPRAAVELIGGQTSRSKQVLVRGMTVQQVASKLGGETMDTATARGES